MMANFDLRGVRSRFILNPNSGPNARNTQLLDRTRAFLAEHRLNATIQLTQRPRHATALAQDAVDRGIPAVVAIGGDGTINEIAAALVGTSTNLGLIPCGSGNGLGRQLGIPGPTPTAFNTLLNGRIHPIDTGTANGHPFFNVMGLGFDAEISARFNRLSRRGFSAYIRTVCRAWRTYRPSSYVIQAEDHRLHSSAFIIAVANSEQYGNNCFIAPGAVIDDGQLNLTVIKRVSFWSALPLAVRLFTRRIDGSSQITRLKSHRFRIERPHKGPIHTDGEVHETGEYIEIDVRPRSLRVIVPAPASP